MALSQLKEVSFDLFCLNDKVLSGKLKQEFHGPIWPMNLQRWRCLISIWSLFQSLTKFVQFLTWIDHASRNSPLRSRDSKSSTRKWPLSILQNWLEQISQNLTRSKLGKPKLRLKVGFLFVECSPWRYRGKRSFRLSYFNRNENCRQLAGLHSKHPPSIWGPTFCSRETLCDWSHDQVDRNVFDRPRFSEGFQ